MANPWEEEDESGPWNEDDSEPIADTPKPSLSDRLAAAAAMYGQGLMQGYYPQVQAGVNMAENFFTGKPVNKEEYKKARDQWANVLDMAKQDFPTQSGAAEMAGGLNAAALLPAATKLSLPARMLIGAGESAAMSGLQNPGEDPEAEVGDLQLSKRLENAKNMAPFGFAGPVVGDILGGGASLAKGAAEKSAFKSLGPFARETIKAHDKGTVERIGREVLDSGLIGWRPRGYESIAKAAESKADEAGKNLTTYLDELSGAATKAEQKMAKDIPGAAPKAGVGRQAIADSMRKDLLNPNTDIPNIVRQNQRIEGLVRQFERGDDDIIPVIEAEMKKRSVGKEINWDRLPGADIPLEEKVQRSLYSKLQKGVEDSADYLEKTTGGPKVGTFTKLKQRYGDLDTAARIANKKEAREMARQFLSPSDMIALGTGGLIGFTRPNSPNAIDPTDEESFAERILPAIALLGANKFRRAYGSQIFAKSADAVGKGFGAASKAANNPWAITSGVKTIKQGAENGKKEEGQEPWNDEE